MFVSNVLVNTVMDKLRAADAAITNAMCALLFPFETITQRSIDASIILQTVSASLARAGPLVQGHHLGQIDFDVGNPTLT